jgi:hypothetical protein
MCIDYVTKNADPQPYHPDSSTANSRQQIKSQQRNQRKESTKSKKAELDKEKRKRYHFFVNKPQILAIKRSEYLH